MYIDTHVHFDMCLEDRTATEDSLVSGLKKNDIKFAVQVSVDFENLDWGYKFAKKNENIFFTLGIHPSSKAGDKELSGLSAYVNKIITSEDSRLLFGIGETGLDFYRMRQPKDNQIKSFIYQIDIAKKFGLPLIVHSRDAFPDTIKILTETRPPAGIMHCFPGNRKMARTALDLGFYISFAGNLTYNKAGDLHESASYVPLDRLLLETDAPFLTPAPHRGKKNRSEYIIHTYKFISELRKEPLEKIQEAVYDNFQKLNKR
ncbi:MAG: TatD family hydrolase [Spirochaetes bacterium]|jgi:TatD DNase family protein|nr:TatD family hydrolase [Spirochaetota bacterium]